MTYITPTVFIAWTGHRPKDLPRDFGYLQFAQALDTLGMHERKDVRFITGGALGVDTWAAEYAISRGIEFDLHLPFNPEVMGRFWTPAQQSTLAMHVWKSRHMKVLGREFYEVQRYQERNESMVDAATVVFTVWSGKTNGGTANCIRYALNKGVAVFNLLPKNRDRLGKLRAVESI